MTAKITYLGQLRTTMVHLQSNNQVITDAPVDNHGKGEAFSPTDLVASALGSCLMTIMGIKADAIGIDLVGTYATVKKHMGTAPRRISEIEIVVYMNQNFADKTQKLLEAAAQSCPVSQSLHPQTRQNIRFVYP